MHWCKIYRIQKIALALIIITEISWCPKKRSINVLPWGPQFSLLSCPPAPVICDALKSPSVLSFLCCLPCGGNNKRAMGSFGGQLPFRFSRLKVPNEAMPLPSSLPSLQKRECKGIFTFPARVCGFNNMKTDQKRMCSFSQHVASGVFTLKRLKKMEQKCINWQ